MQLRQQYGLDRPIPEQYWRLRQDDGGGDLGTSITTHRAGRHEIAQRFPATVELTVAAMLFAVLVGIPLGFIGAKCYGSSSTTGRSSCR